MNKPKLSDYFEIVTISNSEERCAINFVGYAFAVEEYVKELEKQLKEALEAL